MSHSPVFLQPTQSAGRDFMQRDLRGPLLMLNLLRLRREADYSAHPELAPADTCSGRAAFDRYIEHTLPYLQASGGELLLLADGGPWLIGPAQERWDLAMLVRQHSRERFMAFAQDAGYLAGLGHRSAAIEDSRLLPLSAITGAHHAQS